MMGNRNEPSNRYIYFAPNFHLYFTWSRYKSQNDVSHISDKQINITISW